MNPLRLAALDASPFSHSEKGEGICDTALNSGCVQYRSIIGNWPEVGSYAP